MLVSVDDLPVPQPGEPAVAVHDKRDVLRYRTRRQHSQIQTGEEGDDGVCEAGEHGGRVRASTSRGKEQDGELERTEVSSPVPFLPGST